MGNLEVKPCPVCSNHNRERVIEVERVQGIARLECQECGAIYFERNDYPTPVYNLQYNHHFRRPGDIRKAGIMAEKLALLVNKEDILHRILEIGPGNGLTAYLLKFMNYNVEVVEMDKETAEELVLSLGLNVHLGEYEDLPLYTKYDLIYASHIIEHTEQPIRFLEKCKGNLKKNGIIFLDTPCTYFVREYGSTWKHFRTRQPFEHCCLFGVQTIRVAAAKAKLRAVKINVLAKFQSMQVILKKEAEYGTDKDEQMGSDLNTEIRFTYS